MVIDKQTMQRARRVPDAHAHRAIQTALDNLNTQHAPRQRPRWVPMAASGAAALMMVAVLAAVPPLRHRAVSFALDALGRAVPQTDRVNPAGVVAQPTARADSLFLRYTDMYPFYAQVAKLARTVGVSQTVNGVTATVEEAALTQDKLYLTIILNNPPSSSDITDKLSFRVNGDEPISLSGFSDSNKYYIYSVTLPTKVEQPGTTVSVELTFDLNQYSGKFMSGTKKLLGSFALNFTVRMGNALVQIEDTTDLHETAAPDAQATAAADATAQPVPTISITLADLPDPYPPEQATANGDYVNVHGQTSNSDRMTAFLAAVSAKRPAAIRCTNYTVEGDAIIADVVFDGSKFTVDLDTTHDAFGEQKVTQHEYRNMLQYEQDGTTQVYLTNETKITEDLFRSGFDGYLLTSWLSDSAPVAQPQTTVDGNPWKLHGVPMGEELLSIAVPQTLASARLTTESSGESLPNALKESLGDDIATMLVFEGSDGTILTTAWGAGTVDMDEVAKRLNTYWTRGETTTNAAGNEVTVFTGKTDKTTFTSTLLVYRLPEGATYDGKAYPLLVVQVVSPNQRDKWVAGLLEHTTIQ